MDRPTPEHSPTAPTFVHLHVHTEYSLLDGACRTHELVAACRKLGMPAVAVTDHGNLFGAIEFFSAAKAAGIKPIIGCEVYMAPGDRRVREARSLDGEYNHLLLLAQDRTGYQNLIKLTSIGYLEGFYRRPRIDKEVLREFSAGLLCTSTCLGGEIPQALCRDDRAAAKAIAEEYLAIFGPDRFFIELQNHGLPQQQTINPELADLARRLGVGLIATNDVHYLTHDDVEAHDILCCISTRSRVSDEKRFRFDADQFYLKSADEMRAALAGFPEALANTLRVADLCNVDLDFSRRYAPRFAAPAGKTPDDYLHDLVYEGARQRYGDLTTELIERIEYELDVIRRKSFSSYFLVVWDFVKYARDHAIPAVARGSGCSTVVGYCLGISAVDPLRYGLYFERFMDPERDEMPDIDIDLCQDRRPEVIDYVRQKYGHVAQIITFGRLKPRAAIRDICRAMDIPLREADRIAKLVPEELKMTIDKALEREPELARLSRSDPQIRKVLEIARKLENLARHASVHAAGVVIADVPLDTLVPLYKPADAKEITTQFEGPTVEKIGLLKMDFLGLRTLSQIDLACRLVKRHRGVELDLDAIDLADPRVYELLGRGDTRGVFQFESGGMRDVLTKMKPNRIEDLIAANALFRPGPMEYIDEYIARKHGRKKWDAPHPIMTEVLAETYGIMVYQEQVSRLVHRLGNVPLRRAFRLAKAISKKKSDMIDREREPFIQGCLEHGITRAVAEKIFEDILKFGGYAFNKAHSTGYARIAFQTAYLKTYFPVEFMTAMLTYESGNKEQVAEYIDECRRMKIPVRPPDVNTSEEAFTVSYSPLPCKEGSGEGSTPGVTDAPSSSPTGHICFGLAAINGIGHKAVQAILAAREQGGPFRDLFDFCERVDLLAVNKAVLESLIKAGAFDRTGAMRRALMLVLERAMELGLEVQRDRRAGQLNMFGGFAGAAPMPTPKIGTEEWSDSEMLAYEKATLGFYITKHPLAQYEDLLRRFGTATTSDLERLRDGQQIVLGGIVTKIRSVPIKHGRSVGKKLVIATLEDLTGATEVVLFPAQQDESLPLLRPDAIVFIEGAVDRRRETPAIRAARVLDLARVEQEFARELVVRLSTAPATLDQLPRLEQLCRKYPGDCPLYFEVTSPGGWSALLKARDELSVRPQAELLDAVRALLGPASVFVSGPRRTAE